MLFFHLIYTCTFHEIIVLSHEPENKMMSGSDLNLTLLFTRSEELIGAVRVILRNSSCTLSSLKIDSHDGVDVDMVLVENLLNDGEWYDGELKLGEFNEGELRLTGADLIDLRHTMVSLCPLNSRTHFLSGFRPFYE